MITQLKSVSKLVSTLINLIRLILNNKKEQKLDQNAVPERPERVYSTTEKHRA